MKKYYANGRIFEIDLLRGIALLLMIVFHVIFDLHDIYEFNINYESGIYYYIGKTAGTLFIFVSGISCSFSRNNLKRGIKLFLIAMVITIVTYLYSPDLCVKFGVLHFLSICMMTFPLLDRLNKLYMIILGAIIIVIGKYITPINMPFDYLFPFGLTSSSFSSGDYYPIFPWIGVFMYGIAAAKIFYASRKSLFKRTIEDNILLFLSRHTLLIYLIHQPLILLFLYLIMGR